MRKSQGGYLLLELAMLLLVLGFISMQSISWWQQQAQEQRIDALAAWMSALQSGLQSYLLEVSQSTIDPELDFTKELSLVDLQRLGHLSQALASPEQLVVRLFLEPDCVIGSCHLHGIIYSKTALAAIDKTASKGYLLNYFLAKTADIGLVVSEQNPEWLQGIYKRIANSADQLGVVLPINTLAVHASTAWAGRRYLQFNETQNPYFETDVDMAGHLLLSKTAVAGTPCSRKGLLTGAQTELALLLCDGQQWQPLQTGQTLPAGPSGTYELMIYQALNIADCNKAHPITAGCVCQTKEKSTLVSTRYSAATPASSTYRYETYSCQAN